MKEIVTMKVTKSRSLKVYFDNYTGEASHDKYQLILQMITDIKALQEAMAQALLLNNIKLFRECVKEVSSTVLILEHRRFSEVLEFLKFMPDSRERDIVIESFCELSEEILNSLTADLATLHVTTDANHLTKLQSRTNT